MIQKNFNIFNIIVTDLPIVISSLDNHIKSHKNTQKTLIDIDTQSQRDRTNIDYNTSLL